MTKREILKAFKDHDVELKCFADVWWGRLFAWLFPGFWITIGHTIYFPSKVKIKKRDKTVEWTPLEDPLDLKWRGRFYGVLEHELVHIKQLVLHEWSFRYFWKLRNPLALTWFGFKYLCLPLPAFLSWYRWKYEREAYLVQLRLGVKPEDLAKSLNKYARPWPFKWMVKWFTEQKELL